MRIQFKSLQSRILVFVGTLVILIILSLSLINFLTVRRTLIKDVRAKQLLSFTEASQSDLQMVIERAIETSLLMADDPLIVKWGADSEKDTLLGELVKDKLDVINKSGYFTVFLVNNSTRNYWQEGHKLLDVITESDPDDSWFFDFIKSKKKIALNFDYNKELNQTLFFFNALIGTPEQPLGTAGVGINPDNFVKELNSKKITENSRLWMIDKDGKVLISAVKEEIGKNISELLPAGLPEQIIKSEDKTVFPNVSWKNHSYEFAKMKIGTTDFMMLAGAPTSELVQILNPIRVNTFILGLIFFIIAIALAYLLILNIVGPLKRITTVANEFSAGNLIPRIEEDLVARNDEIGRLSAAFREMKVQTSRMILQVKKSANTVSEGSKVLITSSQQLLSRSTQHASATEEVSASMEEMGSNISQNASSAKQTEQIMDKAFKDTEYGSSIVTQTVDAIRNIHQKVQVIEEIAKQTNILALNAAVEAARAGEHGKGFAVVAAEVRKLAERSRESAGEITSLANSSVGVAEQTGKIFTDLVPVIQRASNLVKEISAASNEQDIGANQVNQAVSELDKVSQENANAADNIASLTKEFVDEVEQLQDAISFFKVEEFRK